MEDAASRQRRGHADPGADQVPFARAGRPIDERWEPLVYVDDGPLSRELIEALSPSRRVRMLLRFVEDDGRIASRSRLLRACAALVLAPDAELVATIRRKAVEAGAVEVLTRLDDVSRGGA